MRTPEIAPWEETPQPGPQSRWWVWATASVAMFCIALTYSSRKVSTPAFRTTANTDIAVLGSGLAAFKNEVGRFPTEDEGVDALAEPPAGPDAWNGPYIRRVMRDPWGRRYVYTPTDGPAEPEVRSPGPEGTTRTGDDIVSATP